MGTAARWLPVLLVISVIGWCYGVLHYDILHPMLVGTPPRLASLHVDREEALATSALFLTILALALCCLFLTISTDAGRVPAEWTVVYDAEGGDRMSRECERYEAMETKMDGTRRICRKSNPHVYKPDRAHFCRALGRCVLKMDHFCPWLNNCIGWRNQKYFLLLIGYMWTLTILTIRTMRPPFVEISHKVGGERSVDDFRLCFTFLCVCVLCCGLGSFCLFHGYLVLFNYTTIEFLEKRGCNPLPNHWNRYGAHLLLPI